MDYTLDYSFYNFAPQNYFVKNSLEKVPNTRVEVVVTNPPPNQEIRISTGEVKPAPPEPNPPDKKGLFAVILAAGSFIRAFFP